MRHPEHHGVHMTGGGALASDSESMPSSRSGSSWAMSARSGQGSGRDYPVSPTRGQRRSRRGGGGRQGTPITPEPYSDRSRSDRSAARRYAPRACPLCTHTLWGLKRPSDRPASVGSVRSSVGSVRSSRTSGSKPMVYRSLEDAPKEQRAKYLRRQNPDAPRPAAKPITRTKNPTSIPNNFLNTTHNEYGRPHGEWLYLSGSADGEQI